MLKVYFWVLLFLFFRSASAQQVDTALVVRHLKINLFSELYLGSMREPALYDYYKRELKTTILKSKGFENYIFFKISDQILAVDTILIGEDKKIISYTTPICLKSGEECYFVYAFNKINNRFYKIKGTTQNDFYDLYSALQDKWVYWKPSKKISRSVIKHFAEEFWIDGIDLSCLLRSLKSNRGRRSCLDYFSPELKVY